MKDEISRQDIINLSSSILVNLGLINSAALAASFAKIDAFENIHFEPFAVGLITSLVSQLFWYFDAELEFTFKRKLFTSDFESAIATIIMSLIIVGCGVASAGCVMYGCFRLLAFSGLDSFLCTLLICFMPFFAFYYIAFRRAFEDFKDGSNQ